MDVKESKKAVGSVLYPRRLPYGCPGHAPSNTHICAAGLAKEDIFWYARNVSQFLRELLLGTQDIPGLGEEPEAPGCDEFLQCPAAFVPPTLAKW